MPFHVWLPEAHPAAPTHVFPRSCRVSYKKTGNIRDRAGGSELLSAARPCMVGWLVDRRRRLFQGHGRLLFALSRHDLTHGFWPITASKISSIILSALRVGIFIGACTRPQISWQCLGWCRGAIALSTLRCSRALVLWGAVAVYRQPARARWTYCGAQY